MIQDTQQMAWDDLQDTISRKRTVVLEAITKSPDGLPLFKLVKRLGWPVNRVSGRVTELRRLGRIEDSGLREVNPDSGKLGIVWKAIQCSK